MIQVIVMEELKVPITKVDELLMLDLVVLEDQFKARISL